MSVIEFVNVKKYFHDEPVIDDLNISFDEGKTYLLYGKTGAGKSTIIKMLTAEVKPDAGSVMVYGEDVHEFKPYQMSLYRREIGVVWQDLKLISNRTVYDNLALPLIINNINESIIDEKINLLLADAGVIDFKNKNIASLPFGIKQKIAVIRALITEPKILIADEFMAHLDSDTEYEIWNLVNKYKLPKTTFIWATSQKYVLKTFEGIVVKIDGGKIINDVNIC